jgi:hypothetical protein
MITNYINPKQFLKITRVIYFSLWSGILTFLLLVFFITDNKLIFNMYMSDPLMILTFITACVFLPAGNRYATMTFAKINQNESLMNRLSKYQTGQLIRLATCEGVGLLSIVSLLLTSNLFFLFFLLIALFIMILYYPTPDKIGTEINLTQNEIDMLNN